VRVAWEEVFKYVAGGLKSVAVNYSGEEGTQRLLSQGYQPEMVAETQGAGTRCIKMRGGMGLLGVMGKYGMYRLNNSLALLDATVRGVEPKQALAGRNWSNYTWHGDQAPGQPWVHGLQASDCDFNDLRSSKLIIMDGKNLVENKMTDSHWFIECMERGAKIVVIAPEYGPPSTKADYWIPIRPATDAALWLGVTKLLIDNRQYDETFVKQFTDFPLLVRKDNLKRLRAADVIPGYRPGLKADGASMKIQNLTEAQYAELGDFVGWDTKANAPVAITRDEVGEHLAAKGVELALDGN
jgi:nitrate reductase alpha subunit